MSATDLRRWRRRAFASTWLGYLGFYLARRPFYVAKAEFGAARGWGPEELGRLGAVALVAYAAGQFLAGWAADRVGPRRVLLVGMPVAALATGALGWSAGAASAAFLLGLSGLAQATGWSGTVGTMARWFRRRERGTVMAAWSTNYQVGGVAATALAAWALGRFGLRAPFAAGALGLLVAWALVLAWQRDRPEDAGLPPLDDDPPPAPADGRRPASAADLRANVLLVGGFYFFVKFVRYALWSWAPWALQRSYGLSAENAGYLSAIFDVAGVAGVLAAGFVSDHLAGGRRAATALVFVLGMLGSLGLLLAAGSTHLVAFGAALGLVGFFLYGPDALMSGAGAIEAGQVRRAALAAGVINGMGSVGSAAQELVLGRLFAQAGLDAALGALAASGALATLCLVLLVLRGRRRGVEV